jgi:hypothetical protein
MVKIPPMLADTITCGLSSLDKLLFAGIGPCPYCGARPGPYDTKEKTYATILKGDISRKITVHVRRFRCTGCGALLYANEPFYPDTRVGSAIVDLCVSLSLVNSYSHAAAIINAMGIEIDRGSVRKYALSPLPVPGITFMYGIPMPVSLFTITGRAGSLQSSPADGAEILAASGFPSAYQAPSDLSGTSAARQKQRKEQKQKEKRKTEQQTDHRYQQ